MSPFAGIPVAEMRDRWVPADAVWQRSLDRIRNRVGEAASATEALRGPVDWPEIAQTAGYFDQAHFGREFKDFTGHTPTEYLALRRRFPAERGFPPDNGPMPAD